MDFLEFDFSHSCLICQRTKKKIYSFKQIEYCPIHTEAKESSDALLASYQKHKDPLIYSPIPLLGFSIVVKPSIGSFHTANVDRCLLHVGIVDCTGKRVFNLDQNSRRIDPYNKWSGSVCIQLSNILTDTQRFTWDIDLQEHMNNEEKRNVPYHPMNNNCYSFLVRFLNLIHFKDTNNHTRDSISLNLLELPLSKTFNHIKLYQRMIKEKRKGYIIE